MLADGQRVTLQAPLNSAVQNKRIKPDFNVQLATLQGSRHALAKKDESDDDSEELPDAKAFLRSSKRFGQKSSDTHYTNSDIDAMIKELSSGDFNMINPLMPGDFVRTTVNLDAIDSLSHIHSPKIACSQPVESNEPLKRRTKGGSDRLEDTHSCLKRRRTENSVSKVSEQNDSSRHANLEEVRMYDEMKSALH